MKSYPLREPIIRSLCVESDEIWTDLFVLPDGTIFSKKVVWEARISEKRLQNVKVMVLLVLDNASI